MRLSTSLFVSALLVLTSPPLSRTAPTATITTEPTLGLNVLPEEDSKIGTQLYKTPYSGTSANYARFWKLFDIRTEPQRWRALLLGLFQLDAVKELGISLPPELTPHVGSYRDIGLEMLPAVDPATGVVNLAQYQYVQLPDARIATQDDLAWAILMELFATKLVMGLNITVPIEVVEKVEDDDRRMKEAIRKQYLEEQEMKKNGTYPTPTPTAERPPVYSLYNGTVEVDVSLPDLGEQPQATRTTSIAFVETRCAGASTVTVTVSTTATASAVPEKEEEDEISTLPPIEKGSDGEKPVKSVKGEGRPEEIESGGNKPKEIFIIPGAVPKYKAPSLGAPSLGEVTVEEEKTLTEVKVVRRSKERVKARRWSLWFS